MTDFLGCYLSLLSDFDFIVCDVVLSLKTTFNILYFNLTFKTLYREHLQIITMKNSPSWITIMKLKFNFVQTFFDTETFITLWGNPYFRKYSYQGPSHLFL